ncbi:MAG TPA: polyphosphate kinase 1 [Pyrinomonadaceae bacterium]
MAGSDTSAPTLEARRERASGANERAAEWPAAAALLNRELSLLEFHRRVLEEAQDETQPPLERLKFLTIFSANIDEFFMIRVSGLKEMSEHEGVEPAADGLTPVAQLRALRARLLPLVAEQTRCLRADVLPQLAAAGVVLARYDELTADERAALDEYFTRQVFPVLTPQAVDPAHPFPYVSGLSLNLGLTVEPRSEHGVTASLTGRGERRFARVKVPPSVPRLVPVGAPDATKFVLIEELIAANAEQLFPRMQAGRCYPFRVTRDADVQVREDEAEDLLRSMEQTLRRRRFGTPVRLEVCAEMPREMVETLRAELELTDEDVYAVEGPLNLTDLMRLYALDRPDLKDRPLRACYPAMLRRGGSVFDVLKRRDVLLHHPYTSYAVVTDFVRAAAHDPDVVAIKICLYRTGARSPIPEALIEACERGKQVTAVVELKARFDEEHNIEWAKRLEEAGVHVVYGVLGLKTHCKVALVVRREGEELRRYVHVATGNYNPITSGFYTDLGLLTADEDFGADATELFNFLTGYSRQKEYRRLYVAPVNLRAHLLSWIARETAHARAGRPARIIAKLNRIADGAVIRALYEASQAGVEIDLVVRGVCMLRPGVAGLSETIRVRSIVGRFLEHSRVYYFLNGGEEEVYIGSADWMERNLSRRVEVVAPVLDAGLRQYLKEELLIVYLRDDVKARLLKSDGSYERAVPAPGEQRCNAQAHFAARAGRECGRGDG